jgi:hypothetical protein
VSEGGDGDPRARAVALEQALAEAQRLLEAGKVEEAEPLVAAAAAACAEPAATVPADLVAGGEERGGGWGRDERGADLVAGLAARLSRCLEAQSVLRAKLLAELEGVGSSQRARNAYARTGER